MCRDENTSADEEIILLGKAIAAAKEAFIKTIEDEGYDAAYYSLEIRVYALDHTFTEVLWSLTYSDRPDNKSEDNRSEEQGL